MVIRAVERGLAQSVHSMYWSTLIGEPYREGGSGVEGGGGVGWGWTFSSVQYVRICQLMVPQLWNYS